MMICSSYLAPAAPDCPHISLYAEDHPRLQNAGVVIIHHDDRILVRGTTAVGDKGIPLLTVLLRDALAEHLAQLCETTSSDELGNALMNEPVRSEHQRPSE
jgi:hypothetical protein